MRTAVSELPRLLLCVFDVVPAPTALSRRVTEYLKGLSDRFQVVVLTVKTPDHPHIERYQGARLLRVPVGSGDLAARVQAFDRAVRRQLESEEYVMVHSFDPFGGYALCERRSELGYKVVYDACSLPSVDFPFLYSEEEANRRFIARVRRQELFCLMNADEVIVANDVTREFVSSLGVDREQVHVLPAPVDLAPYTPEVMGLPDATPMKLLHLGHQGDAQDLPTLMEAMQLALQTVDVRLTVVGPKHEAHQARLEEQIAALKLTGKVEFQPPVAHDDLHKVLATCDVGLLTLSDVERNSRVGSPLARLGEYLAAGRPVIAADVPAARAVLPDDGVVLYRSQDAVSLADAIVSLATEPTRRVKLGAAARAASIDRDAAKIRADLVAIYVALSGTGVRAVGDADTTTPDEVTQLGATVSAEEDTQRRKSRTKQRESPSGTNKVRTDPNIVADETSPEVSNGPRGAVMGTPLHDDEPPVVLGEEVQALAAEFAHVTTEPNAIRPTEPPVVMGSPLRGAQDLTPRPLPAPSEPTPLPTPVAAERPDELVALTPPPAEPVAPVVDDEPLSFEGTTRGPRFSEPAGPERTLQGARFSPQPLDRQPSPGPEKPSPPVPALAPERAAPPVLTRTPDPVAPTPLPYVSEKPSPPVPAHAPLRAAPALTRTPDAVGPTPAPAHDPLRAAPVQNRMPDASGKRGGLVSEKAGPPVLEHVPLGVAEEDDAPFADDADLAPVQATPARGLPTAPAEPDTPFADDADLAPIKEGVAEDEAPFVDDSELSPVTGLTPSRGLPAAAPRPPPLAIPPLMTPVPQPPPLRTTSGLFAPVPSSPSRAEGFVPLLTPPGALPPPVQPPPLPRSTSGIFPVVASSPSATGLFPEPPRVPAPAKPVVVAQPAPPIAEALADVPEEPLGMAAEEAVMTVDTDSAPPASSIDPWLAQLVFGYCPPASGFFERHAPPTTMPGRDT